MKSIYELDSDKTIQSIGDHIRDKVGKRYGFMVLVFPFSASGKPAQYISSASRRDMIKMLRETANVLEAHIDIVNEEGNEENN